ncbi:MAG: LysR substrate-binding domain-containing protein, partial [Gammaproteobacteria bacterium]|nr:LysR substrate-binding domain-containing protein [Gammaproteobacteria bacterium]
ISRQINELEAELGVRLLHRTTRSLSLTEAGQIYYERAKRIITDVDEARLAVTELGAPTGILRVTAPSGIGRELIVSAVSAFLQRYPGVRVVLSMTDYVVDLVEGGFDVGIRVGRLADSTLKARRIGESRRVVCASPHYLRSAGTPESPADLERHNCITFRDQPGHSVWRFRSPSGVTQVRVSGSFFARSADALAAAAVADIGLVLLPDWNIGLELRQRQLAVVLSSWEAVPGKSPIWAVHAHQRHVPSKIRAFIDFLVEWGAGASADLYPKSR